MQIFNIDHMLRIAVLTYKYGSPFQALNDLCIRHIQFYCKKRFLLNIFDYFTPKGLGASRLKSQNVRVVE